jgi:outer membrane protein
MNKFAFGAATAALAIGLSGPAYSQHAPAATIVVVDGGRVYSECTACRAASAQLQTMVQQAQARQQQLGQPMQTEAQAIDTEANRVQALPAGPAKNAAQTALQNRLNALQARQAQANQELQRLEQNLQSTRANVGRQINERLSPIYTQIMNAHGANLLVDVDATLAHAPALDVTTEVLAALNAALPSVSVTPLPANAAPAGQPNPQGR